MSKEHKFAPLKFMVSVLKEKNKKELCAGVCGDEAVPDRA
jgi:hypothetical protein